jgi:S1-C subfamily serine protease
MRKALLSLFLALGLLVTPAIADSPFNYPRAETVSLDAGGNGNCSGVVIEPGWVLTAAHCTNAYEGWTITGKPDVQSFTVLSNQDTVDLGLLQFSDGVACPCVKLAEFEAQPDEPVIIVGFPLGITQVVTEGRAQGIVENVHLEAMWMTMDLGRRLVLTATAAPGNSGGGVFVKRDNQWQLVGILVEGTANLTFAVPLSDIKDIIKRARSLD